MQVTSFKKCITLMGNVNNVEAVHDRGRDLWEVSVIYSIVVNLKLL